MGRLKTEELLKNKDIVREINNYKWIESEKAGRDIGFERALLDWMLNHRTPWRYARIASKRTR